LKFFLAQAKSEQHAQDNVVVCSTKFEFFALSQCSRKLCFQTWGQQQGEVEVDLEIDAGGAEESPWAHAKFSHDDGEGVSHWRLHFS